MHFDEANINSILVFFFWRGGGGGCCLQIAVPLLVVGLKDEQKFHINMPLFSVHPRR